MKKLPRLNVSTVLLGVGGITAVFLLYAAYDVYRFAQRDEAQPTDAAIVLGAAVFGNRPSPVLRERINHAIQLYEDGLVTHIIFTGGSGGDGEATEAAVSAAYAMRQGVPQSAILLEEQSTNTRENLANAQQIGAEHQLESFLIVSTPFHMRRATLIAAELEMTAHSSPTRSTRWISPYTRFRAYAREVVAYVAYLLT